MACGPIIVVGIIAQASGPADSPLVYTFGLAAIGNPQAVISAAIILGLRRPAAWAFVLLTKIGPGIGLAWFIFQRDWRRLALALGVTGLVAGISFAASPQAWVDFVAFAAANQATPAPVSVVPVPFYIRAPMTLALLFWGARANRQRTVLAASGWASLALYQRSYLAPWAAALVLFMEDRRGAAIIPTPQPPALPITDTAAVPASST